MIIYEEQIRKMLLKHKIWLRTNGKDGKRAIFENVEFQWQFTLKFSDWDSAIFRNVKFNFINFEGSNFNNVYILNCDFKNCRLNSCSFVNATIIETNFSYANLEHTEFINTKLFMVDLSFSRLDYANLEKSNMDIIKIDGIYFNEETIFPDYVKIRRIPFYDMIIVKDKVIINDITKHFMEWLDYTENDIKSLYGSDMANVFKCLIDFINENYGLKGENV